eukprot:959769-Alexandrium_andersonii.AAC.1
MSASLVGSEMCIRDSAMPAQSVDLNQVGRVCIVVWCCDHPATPGRYRNCAAPAFGLPISRFGSVMLAWPIGLVGHHAL